MNWKTVAEWFIMITTPLLVGAVSGVTFVLWYLNATVASHGTRLEYIERSAYTVKEAAHDRDIWRTELNALRLEIKQDIGKQADSISQEVRNLRDDLRDGR